ncbi:hypothetical protein B0H15DRAFT_944962 [Mycena belliarum]|uniref:Arrestin C-terminal-like domain-containing protein n=1 Tax=Mycena belliarum TaxID=1033014 RepID=A0AAD6UDD6_9AGAR|nr:hypothetical protein B0H15DRAFT_944962 [Mycena belliae]
MPKNTLTIRLTEAAVYLRTSDNNARRRPTTDLADAPAILRGLLTLTIVKPIKITSIDLELQAKTSSSWPEGTAARRVDVQEDHKVFSESQVFFRAGPAPRRTASVGPGVDPWQDEDYVNDQPSRPTTPPNGVSHPMNSARVARRLSVDSSYFHMSRETQPPIPPYTPLPTPPFSPSYPSSAHSSGHTTRLDDDPALALEDFRNALRAASRSNRGDRSPGGPLLSSASSLRDGDRSLSRRPSIETLAEVDEERRDAAPGSSSPNHADGRGRRARFSLSSVSTVLKEVVRSGSTRSSKERGESIRRGRPREKATTGEEEGSSNQRPPLLDKLAGLPKEDVKDKGKTGSWKEFKKGTYTFPISFTIPSQAPPTMECPYGTVAWRLKANVHRPGAFALRMTATRPVIVVAAPSEDDPEETENILVERHWDQQLQYLISISGRSFPIGGAIPVTLTLLPLAKVKIYRLSIYLEEKVEYYSQMKHVARTDPVHRIQLLSIKHDDKEGRPVLPLDCNGANAIIESPLVAFTLPGNDLTELASEWMGPGPWTFNQELILPPSCNSLHFTNKNKRGNITVTHVLKCVIRVERGDDEAVDAKTGKRKLFDIIVQTPVHILSCRCNSEWMSLPQYSASFEDPVGSVAPNCPCEMLRQRHGDLERMTSRHSTDSSGSGVEPSPAQSVMHSPHPADTLFARNTLFERLVSGQESELGEAPPAYGA